jgi:hypothetical protein
MKFRIVMLVGASLVAVFISKPAHLRGQQAPEAQQHEQHHPATAEPTAQASACQQPDMAKMMAAMKATDQKLDELVKRMNADWGTAKVDVAAELLTALVQDRRAMHESMMSHMSMMMNMTGSAHGCGDATPKP